jgi:hypothetical protein
LAGARRSNADDKGHDMNRLTLTTAILALVALLAVAAAPAAAEFKANNKATEGSADFQILIEGTGTPIDCGDTETSHLKWQIKKEGKSVEKGPELGLKFSSWGKCVVEYKEGEKTVTATLTGGECQWETKETGSEREVTNKIASACKLKGEIAKKSCEVTLEPKSNEKLSSLTLIDSGEKNENLAINLGLKNVTVGVAGGGCEAAGIKPTSTGELKGAIEALSITGEVPVPGFSVYYVTSNTMTAVGQKRTVGVINNGAGAAPGMKLLEAGNSPWFKVANQTVAACQGGFLNMGASCQMEVEFKLASSNIKTLYIQIWEGGVVTSEVPIFAIS